MKNFFKNNFKAALILLIAVVFTTVIIQFLPQNQVRNPFEVIKGAEKKLEEFKKDVLLKLEKISQLSNETEINNFILQNRQTKSGFSFYVLNNNVLQYWSDNEPAVNDSVLAVIRDEEFLHLSNGDFIAYKIEYQNRKAIGLILLKHSYDYQNKYLVNNFNPALCIGNDFEISTTGDTLHLPGNKPAYILKQDPLASSPPSALIVWIYFILAIVVLISIYLFLKHFSKSFILTIIFLLIVAGLRTLMIFLKLPLSFYNHGIFSPSNYASSFYFNSLGDMLINAALFLVLSISLYENILTLKKNKLILISVWIFSAVIIHFLISGLVINSNISFELNSPADINIYSILAFTSVSILLLCFLFLTAGLFKIIWGYRVIGRHVWFGISICAIYTALSLTVLNREKEYETRKLIAQKAKMGQDHIAEFLFWEQENKILSDPSVLSILHSGKNVNEKLFSLISQKYFSGYLSKFELNVIAFDEKDSSDQDVKLDFYLNEAQKGGKTYSKRLFFLKNETGGTYYLAILPFNGNEHRFTLALSMTARFLHSVTGFPELFISGKNQDNTVAEGYSLARYSGESLVFEYGNYIYPLTGKEFLPSKEEFTFLNTNGYTHLINRINENSFIVVSKPEGNLLGVLTLFSWMFTFMSILTFILFIFSGFIEQGREWEWNLTRRVQASVIFLVVLTFVLVGSGTVYYINRKYVNDQRKSISDQVNALWFMLSKNLFSVSAIENKDTSDQYKQLDRLVNNTNIDFNVYNGNGQMVYSSQPKIFDKGIISMRMNQEAFFGIKEKGLTQFIHPENVGLLNYIAAYAPFTDRSGNIIAFLNLPYFEKQNELNKEVSIFLSAIVNIYVLLFALAVLITIFISSRITKPLLLIQEKMAGIRLGATNEKIEYKENDEIGKLVHEYNRMIDELSISAEKLARSERESAWREMARQVAHEIKNPLTPMKLSVQHLHRTFKEKNIGDEHLVDRITTTLIQQIDTLSNIATAFSNFAQMPLPLPVKIDLRELLLQVSSLYYEGVDVEFQMAEIPSYVLADKDQLIGVFSNLMKNAVQSIPDNRRGKLAISLRREASFIVVEISDNGIGIPEDQRDKIFTPNFTTKSSGMGLGLAFVRNIVEEASGKVWFTSTYKIGSSFFVSLPEAS